MCEARLGGALSSPVAGVHVHNRGVGMGDVYVPSSPNHFVTLLFHEVWVPNTSENEVSTIYMFSAFSENRSNKKLQ